MDTWAQYANPPHNILGTTLFLSYIGLALYCTASITLSLYTQYSVVFSQTQAKKDGKGDRGLRDIKDARARHIKIYAFLASISFATVSYHMLSFLIISYSKWNGTSTVRLSDVSTEKLKRWMLQSALFESFAKELVRDGPSAMWTQAAILGTWFWSIWMAQKANRYRFTKGTMLKFIMLSQILPISFTLSLFLIQLHLSAPDLKATATPDSAPEETNTTTPRAPKSYKKTSLTLPTILLNASLLALAPLHNHPTFIPLVLFTRLLLLLPHSGRVSLRDADVLQSISVSGGFVVANLVMMKKTAGLGDVLRGLGTGGEAVRALGWDAVVGVVVYAVLGWGGGV